MRYIRAMNATVVDFAPPRPPLFGADDPPPFEIVNEQGRAPAVLICDHASRAVPRALDDLGLDRTLLRRHIGWDIGAADVTRRLAALIDAPAVLASYSRLVIDCNRTPGSPGSIPAVSDGVEVPGNQALDAVGIEARVDACFLPYHHAVDRAIAAREAEAGVAALIAIHSFTPIMDGFERPWHIGILWDRDRTFAEALIAALARDPSIQVGDNAPYSGRLPIPYSIPVHGTGRDRPHVAVEIRQDLIDTRHDAEAWAGRLAAALAPLLDDPGVIRRLDPDT